MPLEMPNLLAEMDDYKILASILIYGSTLIAVVAGVMVAYHLLMRMKAEDDHTSVQHTRALRTTIVGALLLLGVGQIFLLMVHFTGMSGYLKSLDNAKSYAPCYGFGWKKDPICP